MLVFMFISLAIKSSNLTGHPSSSSEHVHLISFPHPAHLTQYSTPPMCSTNSIMKKKKFHYVPRKALSVMRKILWTPSIFWSNHFIFLLLCIWGHCFPCRSLKQRMFFLQHSTNETTGKWCASCFSLPFRILSLSLNQTCYFEAPTTRFHATPTAIPLMSMHFPNAYFPSFIEDLATNSRSSFPIYFCYNSWKYQISYMKLI